MILLDHRPAGQFAHTHDMIGMVHTVLLYGVDGRIDIAAAAIEVGRVDMDHQWHTEDLLGVDTCRIGDPVVGMDQVVVVGSGDHAGDDGVVIDLVDQVVPILPGELDAPYIVRQHIPEVRVDMVPQVVVLLRTHHATDPLLEILSRGIMVDDRHLTGTDDPHIRGVLISGRSGQHQGNVHILLRGEPLRDAVGSSPETSGDMRGKLPAKHKCFHTISVLLMVLNPCALPSLRPPHPHRHDPDQARTSGERSY